MRIKLDDNWEIRGEAACWVLAYIYESEKKDGSGTTTYENTTYHGQLYAALKYYVDECLKPAKSVVELMAEVNRLNTKIEGVLKDIKRHECFATNSAEEPPKGAGTGSARTRPPKDVQVWQEKDVAGDDGRQQKGKRQRGVRVGRAHPS